MAATESSFHPVVPEISEPSLRTSGGREAPGAPTDAAGLPVRATGAASSPAAPSATYVDVAPPAAIAAAADSGWFSLSGLAIILVVLLIGIAAVGWFFTRSEETKSRPAVPDDLSTFATRAGSEFESILERRRLARKNPPGGDSVPAPIESPGLAAEEAANPSPVVVEPEMNAANLVTDAADPDTAVVPIAPPTPASMSASLQGGPAISGESLYEHVQRESALAVGVLDVSGPHDEVDVDADVGLEV